MSKFAAHLYAADSVGEERGVVSEAQRRRIRQSDRPGGLCRVQGAGIVGMALPAARKIAGHGIRVMISAPGVFWLPAGKLAEGGAAFAGHARAFPSRLGPAARVRRSGVVDRGQSKAEPLER
jgi:hypothetical protein